MFDSKNYKKYGLNTGLGLLSLLSMAVLFNQPWSLLERIALVGVMLVVMIFMSLLVVITIKDLIKSFRSDLENPLEH